MSNMKHPIPQGKSKARGFTMVELIVVIAVIGILSAIALVKFQSLRSESNMTAARAAGAQFERVVAVHCAKDNLPATDTLAITALTAEYPNGLPDMQISATAPTNGTAFTCAGTAGVLTWDGPYCKQTDGTDGSVITYTAGTGGAVATVACSAP